jgi:hypothetical protein
MQGVFRGRVHAGVTQVFGLRRTRPPVAPVPPPHPPSRARPHRPPTRESYIAPRLALERTHRAPAPAPQAVHETALRGRPRGRPVAVDPSSVAVSGSTRGHPWRRGDVGNGAAATVSPVPRVPGSAAAEQSLVTIP